MTTVLVCGGRTYDDAFRVRLELNKIRPARIIHGGARGADYLADCYAEMEGIDHRSYPIRRPHEDGYRRNQRMLNSEPIDLVLAFPGGSGTADMVRRARAANIPVIEVK